MTGSLLTPVSESLLKQLGLPLPPVPPPYGILFHHSVTPPPAHFPSTYLAVYSLHVAIPSPPPVFFAVGGGEGRVWLCIG